MKKTSTLFRITLILMITGLFSIQLAQAQKFTYSDPLNKAGFTLNEQTRGGVTIDYSIKSFTMAPVEINGRGMKNIELPGFWLPNDEGAPNLPGGGKYIAIPQGAVPVLKIVSQRTESYKNIDIAPAPRIPLDTDNGPLEYPTRTDIYSMNAFYPASPVILSQPSKIRGVDIVMLGITPFQYNPVTKELIVYRDIKIEIEFQGGYGQFGEERLRSRFWDPILSDALLNYQSIPAIDYGKRAIANRSNDGCEYLIIVPDGEDFMTWANLIKTFRIRQGITTEIRTLTDIGGNSASVIEAYINNVYNTWDPVPSAILLMADYGTNQNSSIIAPIWSHTGYNSCASDNIYGDVDNDDMPEIVMARMVANNNTELETMVTKFINYESNPPASPAFYDHPITALGWQTERWFQICSETVGGYFKNVQGKNPVRINEIYSGNPNSDPWSTADNTQVVLDEFGPTGLGYIPSSPQQLGNWSGGDATDVNNAINAGAFILQHRDHGAETGWGEPAYNNSNINGLTNTDLTFVFSINCLTGKYNWSSECFVEKFHRYRYNNVNSGALAVLGASEVSYSFVNDTYVWGVFDNMWPDFMPEYGSTPAERGLLPAFANAAGKYFLQQSSWPHNGGDKEVTYNLFHHFGDAFLTLYSEVPQDLTILHDGIILAGMNEFTISADTGSTICLTVGDNIIGLAQGTGSPVIVTIPPQSIGTTVLLTVTKTNYYRYEETLEVIPAEGAYCLYDEHTIADGDGGNGNGLVDYNETVGLNLGIRNVGLSNGDSVTVTISTIDPFITLNDNTEFYGEIPAGQTVTIDNGFSFTTAENIPDQHEVIFSIISTDGTHTWNSSFMLKVNAPQLSINTLTINDQANGNGNGKLDPGEQVTMTINYSNSGHAAAYDVDVYLEGQSGFVEVLNPTQNFSSIGFLGMFNKVFDVTVDVDAPDGIVVNFNNELTMGSLFQDKIFCEKISALIEDFETGNFTKFNWQFAGNLPWETSIAYPYEGFFSARSGAITANQMSEIKLSYQVMSGDTIAFVRKVSSEPADKLQFYIGNELMGEWSGVNEGWRREAYYITPGYKTFKWVYSKNASTNGGSDKGWLDNIVLPPRMSLTIWAGPDEKICSGNSFQVVDSYGTDYSSVIWTSSGTGTFDDNTQIQPVYTPSYEDFANGSVELTLTLADSEGNIVTDEMVLTFKYAPEAPQTAEGPGYVDLFVTTTSEYATAGFPGISEYTWYLDPAEAGIIEGTGLTSTVTWNPDYLGTAYISVTATDECGEGENSVPFEVTVDNTVGIGNPESYGSGFSIYPNPGNGLFNIQLSSEKPDVIQMKLSNVLGEIILCKPVQMSNTKNYQLNLEDLPDGIYFLVIEGDGQSVTKKLVKK
jgi:hypothetical protein